MTISGEMLRRHGIALTPHAFEAVVRAAIERLPVVGSPTRQPPR